MTPRHPATVVAILAALVVGLLAGPAAAQTEPAATDTTTGPADAATAEPSVMPTAGTAASAAPVVPSGVAGRAVSAVLAGLVEWTVTGARWVIGEVVSAMDTVTRPRITAGWFLGYLARMAQIAGGWVALLFLAAVIDGAVRGRGDVLARAVLLLPVAAGGTAVAVFTLDLLIAATDHAAGWLVAGTSADLTRFATTVGTALIEYDADLAALAVLVAGFALTVAGIVVWVELLLRDAAVYVAVLFLPLAFAGLVWPATAHWLGRLLRLVVAVVLSKLVIVAVFGLGATMLADGMAADGLAPVIVGVGTLLLAGLTPFVLYRIVQVWDIDQTGGLQGAFGGAAAKLTAPIVGGAVLASKLGTRSPPAAGQFPSPWEPPPTEPNSGADAPGGDGR